MTSGRSDTVLVDLLIDLKHHDWFHEYSDDLGVYTDGVMQERRFARRVASLPRHERELVLSSEAVPQERREAFRESVMKELSELKLKEDLCLRKF